MCGSLSFGRLQPYHQELTTALTASGYNLGRDGSSTVGRGLAVAVLLVVVWPILFIYIYNLERSGSSAVGSGLVGYIYIKLGTWW